MNLTNIVFSKIHAKCIVATRFYLYLEAGIPVLVSADHVELGDLVAKYQIGVVADWDENFDLNEVVQNYDLNAMRRNVISARKDIFDIGLHQLL